jgi:DNA polymerase-4
MVGRASGRQLHALAHNRDARRVQARRRRRSMGAQRALGRGPHRLADVDASLIALVDRVTRRMRSADRVGRTVVLRLRFDDFERATRSRTMTTPTAETTALLAAARGLLAEAAPLIEQRGVTLVGVSITNLGDPRAIQLVLPFEPDRSAALDAALDEVRGRFGSGSLTRAVLLGRGTGWEMPMLPD